MTSASGGRRRRAALLTPVLVLLFAATAPAASAAAPPGPYFNGFETDTAGWSNRSGATISRVSNGSSGTYANGVLAATGTHYARLGEDPSPDSCTFGGGTASIYYGPYTNFGGYSSIFPTGGYSTGVDVYLDVPYAISHPDTRFDWSSAINDPSGNFRRDFVFNVGTDPLGFVMTGGNNATRCGANPADPGHAPVVHISQSGWYTFKHTFSGVSGGPLTVTLQVLPSGSNIPIGTWVRSDASDIIGTTVGGNRYGWFVQNEFDGLAIDNSFRTGISSTEFCEVTITNGGWMIANNGDRASFGGNAKVDANGNPKGQEEYQDQGPAQPMTVHSTGITATTCSSDRTEASIYGEATIDGSGTYMFRIDVTDHGSPGADDTYGITLSNGYSSGTHTLRGGNVTIH